MNFAAMQFALFSSTGILVLLAWVDLKLEKLFVKWEPSRYLLSQRIQNLRRNGSSASNGAKIGESKKYLPFYFSIKTMFVTQTVKP